MLLGRRRWVNPNAAPKHQTHSEWVSLSHGPEEVLMRVVTHLHKVKYTLQNIHLWNVHCTKLGLLFQCCRAAHTHLNSKHGRNKLSSTEFLWATLTVKWSHDYRELTLIYIAGLVWRCYCYGFQPWGLEEHGIDWGIWLWKLVSQFSEIRLDVKVELRANKNSLKTLLRYN